MIVTNSAAEYWRGDAWLAHGDAATGTDLDDPPDARHYLFAGVDHLGDLGALASMFPARNPAGAVDAVASERALFVALEHWVRDGVDPPASRVPRVDDGTATTRDEVLARFRAIPGIATPDGDALPTAHAIDLGADAGFGVVSHPMGHGPPYPNHVAAVDDDGNEVAGIRVPMVSVPVATYTGWNVRPAIDGLPALMPDFLGSRLPFTATRRRSGSTRRPASCDGRALRGPRRLRGEGLCRGDGAGRGAPAPGGRRRRRRCRRPARISARGALTPRPRELMSAIGGRRVVGAIHGDRGGT